jgi:hypothetical protein
MDGMHRFPTEASASRILSNLALSDISVDVKQQNTWLKGILLCARSFLPCISNRRRRTTAQRSAKAAKPQLDGDDRDRV